MPKMNPWIIALSLCLGCISHMSANTDFGDANVTQEELTHFNEKYLKHKIQPDTQRQSNTAKTIKISDITTLKDVNKTMRAIEYSAFGQSLTQMYQSEHASNIEALSKDQHFRDAIKENKRFILENYEIAGKKMDSTHDTREFIEHTNRPNSREKLFIVISSSMPDTLLRDYFKQLEGKENVTFVLRGLVGSATSFKPTKEYLERIVKKYPLDPNNQEVYTITLEINPKVTRKYGIEKAPAFIYVANDDGQLETSAPIDPAMVSNFWIAYGVSSLEHTIEQINSEAKSTWLDSLLDKETFFKTKSKEK